VKLLIACIGRASRGPERDLYEHYANRIRWPLALRELEEKRKLPTAQMILREGELLLGAVPAKSVLVALDRRGKVLDSEAFAGRLAHWRDNSVSDVAFLIGGVFYIAFSVSRSFGWALFFLAIAHTGGSILWVFSTVLLQRDVGDKFRGRVFAAELALLTLTMAASNYIVGELMDRFGFSPRTVTAGVGTLFLLPGLIWFATQKWWDRKAKMAEAEPTEKVDEIPATVSTEHFEV